jgi:hypothetical protein
MVPLLTGAIRYRDGPDKVAIERILSEDRGGEYGYERLDGIAGRCESRIDRPHSVTFQLNIGHGLS